MKERQYEGREEGRSWTEWVVKGRVKVKGKGYEGKGQGKREGL